MRVGRGGALRGDVALAPAAAAGVAEVVLAAEGFGGAVLLVPHAVLGEAGVELGVLHGQRLALSTSMPIADSSKAPSVRCAEALGRSPAVVGSATCRGVTGRGRGFCGPGVGSAVTVRPPEPCRFRAEAPRGR